MLLLHNWSWFIGLIPLRLKHSTWTPCPWQKRRKIGHCSRALPRPKVLKKPVSVSANPRRDAPPWKVILSRILLPHWWHSSRKLCCTPVRWWRCRVRSQWQDICIWLQMDHLQSQNWPGTWGISNTVHYTPFFLSPSFAFHHPHTETHITYLLSTLCIHWALRKGDKLRRGFVFLQSICTSANLQKPLYCEWMVPY